LKKRIVRLVGVTVVGLGILTTACGSDDSTSDGSEATVEETTTTASEPAATTEKPAYTDADHERFIATGGTGEIIDDGQIWETQSGTDAYVGLSGEGTYTFEVLDASGRPSRATWTGTLALS
jgi:hypothetical protein